MKIVLDTNVLVYGLLTPFCSSGEIVRMVFSGEILLCIDARIKVRSLVTGNTIHYPLSLREGIDIFSPSEFIEYYRKHVTVHRVAKSDALQTT